MKYLMLAGTLLMGFLSDKAVAAQTDMLINVNFKPVLYDGHTYSGSAMAESLDPGTYYWNEYSANGGVNLVPTYAIGSGNAKISYSFRFPGAITTVNSGFGQSPLYSLMGGYLLVSGSSGASITVSDLDPLTSYYAYFYTQGDKTIPTQQSTDLTVTVNNVMTFDQTIATNTSSSTFIEGQNVLKALVESDENGKLLFKLKPGSQLITP